MLGLFAFWAMLCPVSWRSVIHCQGWNVNKNWDDMRLWHHDICHVCICVCSLISFSTDLRLKIIADFACHILYLVKSVREKDFCASSIIFANFGAKKCCNFQSNDTNFAFELILDKDNVLSSSGSDLTSINFKVTYKLSSRGTPCGVSMGTLFET